MRIFIFMALSQTPADADATFIPLTLCTPAGRTPRRVFLCRVERLAFFPTDDPLRLMSMSLNTARKQIDAIDQRLVDLLAKRQAVVDDISAVKAASDRDVRDPDREAQLLNRLRDYAKRAGLSPDLVTSIYGTILEHSVARQKMQRQDSGSLAA